ncbi:hypothetical protein QBC38DRAFT_467224 [Podospora fimiseda]|uniref:DUF7721 domain-containing protein n=1 Tax=Podospora fimiseda TaxID=252190 RepID=A0AAN7BYF2_9PEZI|nr:hypothetical protein QBC38DRAFT_467224 [Podospora fimiseda]
MDFIKQAKDVYFNPPKDEDTDSDNDEDQTNLKKAAKYAAVNTSNESDDKHFFKSILTQLSDKKSSLEQEDIDEEDAITSHKSIFDPSIPTPSTTSSSLGSAAALQALKLFNASPNTPAPADPKAQNAFVGLAMAQAAKLFDQKASEGKVSEGADKNTAVLKAGELALKMYLKGNKSGGVTSGAGFGGLGAGLVGAYLSGGLGGDKEGGGGGSALGGLVNVAVAGHGGGKEGGSGGGLLGNVGKLF